MLTLAEVTLHRGAKTLLDRASITLPADQRIGIIGRNGCGKSSLFAATLSKIDLDQGVISMPKDWQIGVLAQDLPTDAGSVLEVACQGDAEWVQLMAQLAVAEDNADAAAMATIHDRLAQIDGYTIQGRASKICRGLGFTTEELSRPLSTFSGGWQMRVQLAKVLLSRSQLLLLDEPTNHLDLEAAVWLASWLKSYRGCTLIISHDRDFLDEVTQLSLHFAQCRLKLYAGGYSAFVKQFQEELLLQSKEAKKTEQKRHHLQSFVDRFRAEASKAKQAQSRLKALEKLTISSELEADSDFHFSFQEPAPVPYPAIRISGDIGYGDSVVLKNINFSLGTHERIGLVGRNGSGKTTFLKALCGELSPRNGEQLVSSKVNMGYYSQQWVDSLDPKLSAFKQLQAQNPDANASDIRQHLGHFAFQGDRVFEPIEHFSGGEKARVALACLVWKKPNILILDEPTNHLDIIMRDALIMALQTFSGTVIIVSHDRYLLESCVDHLLWVHNQKVTPYEGSFDEYLADVLRSRYDEPKQPSKKSISAKDRQLLQKTINRLEKEVDRLSEQLSFAREKLAAPELYQADQASFLQDLQAEEAKLAEQLQLKQDDWVKYMQAMDDSE